MTPEQMTLKQAAEIVALGHCDGNFSDVQARFDELATASAILSLIAQVEALTVPQGWKLVPIKPTIKMIAALGYAGDEVLAVGHGLISKGIADDYAAMLDAAPTIPAIPGTKEDAT